MRTRTGFVLTFVYVLGCGSDEQRFGYIVDAARQPELDAATDVSQKDDGGPPVLEPGPDAHDAQTKPDSPVTDTGSGELSAAAGPDQDLTDQDGDTWEGVTLDASGSLGAAQYQWLENGTVLASSMRASVDLNVGEHRITLKVSSGEKTLTDELVVWVRARAPGLQRMNLSEAPTGARFTLPNDSVWPSAVGEAAVCLWAGDRFAALSLTIDDNIGTQQSWWKSILATSGLKATWFIITGEVGKNTMGGTWDGLRALVADGHAIGSHANSPADPTSWDEARWRSEFETSMAALSSNLPGVPIVALAHPWGRFDRAIVDDYFTSARGVRGLVNPANQIDYLNASSFSMRTTASQLALGEQDLVDMVSRADGALTPGNANRHAWLIHHFHFVDPALQAKVEQALNALAGRPSLWVAPFQDVARYGQERDTSKVVVTTLSDGRLSVDVRDEMDDGKFTVPLTIKIRVPDAWSTLAASHRRADWPVKRVVDSGKIYAMFDVTPDAGAVIVGKKP